MIFGFLKCGYERQGDGSMRGVVIRFGAQSFGFIRDFKGQKRQTL